MGRKESTDERSDMKDPFEEKILQFVEQLGEGKELAIDCDTELIRSGIIDSLGILDLVVFVETTFDVVLDESDMAEKNLNCVARVAELVKKKTNG